MTYAQFKIDVFNSVVRKMGNDYLISQFDVTKNNGKVLQGISIKNPDYNIAPTFYLNPLWERFGDDVEAAARAIVHSYYDNEPTASFPVDSFMDWQYAKDKIIYRVINAELNQTLLSHCPHFLLGDLAVVYSYRVIEDAFINISNDHLDIWHVTPQELWSVAQDNIKKMAPHIFKPMRQVIAEMVKSSNLLIAPFECEEANCLFVATNSSGTHGASVIADNKFLEDFAEEHGDFIILPSSIHECIFVTKMTMDDLPELSELVSDINEEVVASDEILGSHAYFYDSNKKQLIF